APRGRAGRDSDPKWVHGRERGTSEATPRLPRLDQVRHHRIACVRLTTLEPIVQPTTTLKRTPFYPFHKALGAKLVDFAGFEMPVRYTGDVREHQAVRERVGLFDISHMGEFHVSGAGALEFLNHAITNDVGALSVGDALYSPLCRADGGIVDDLLV